jgi:hypothetical protein
MILTPEQLRELEAFINTIPTQYGMPSLNFFARVQQEQPKSEVLEAVEEQ